MTKSDLLKRQVIFTGYYGNFNTGDDAFCAISAWGADHYWKTNDIYKKIQQANKLLQT